MLVLKNVSKVYGRNKVLNGISFRVDPKEFVCITGPSGAGKSTLLHLMIGAELANAGSVAVDGVDLHVLPPTILQLFRRRIGVVFQDFKLLWERTVAENVAFPLEVAGAPDDVIEKRVKEVLKEMRLTRRAHTMANALSGGEKARTAIARAIVHKPIMLFADEPTGNLDPGQTQMVLDLFKQIHKQGTTIVLATHEVDIVDTLQTRVIRLEDGAIVRDSIGGYRKGKSASQAKEPTHAKHEIFDEEQERKVKITAKNV
ncbi:cell division ATP-binding protein FtsE [Candidatus Peregrinibacteria bacterium CG10_big_fil_rev_8_21_14_0_10_49_10]|nr:MAG: cell division ATP-binding protein FtsE [Candidatus Peregrinibacteria bacterium CG10_big_fil_rev_8_21_14_0_10_49_10]